MDYMIGCYTDGNPGLVKVRRTGEKLEILGSTRDIANSTYLCLDRDGKYIYTGTELAERPEDMIIACIDAGSLKRVSACSAQGQGPCHFAVYGEYVLTANYDAGSISVYRSDGGMLSPVQVIRHGLPGITAHAHCIVPDEKNGFVHAVDLGLDAVITYRTDGGKGLFEEFSRSLMPKGCGPRHMIRLEGDIFCLACELGNLVMLLKWNGERFDILQSLGTLPEGITGSWAAAIKARGDMVYVSNRGHDSLAAFRYEGGRLAPQGHIMLECAYPRDFSLCEDGAILAAGQKSGDLVLLVPEGKGYRKADRIEVKGAVCIVPLPERGYGKEAHD